MEKTTIKLLFIIAVFLAINLNATSKPKPAKPCYRIPKPRYAVYTPCMPDPDTLTIICRRLDHIIIEKPHTYVYQSEIEKLKENFCTIKDAFEKAEDFNYKTQYYSSPTRWNAFFNSKDYFVHFSGTILRSIIQAIINLPMTTQESFLFDILDWFYRLQIEALPKIRPCCYQQIINDLGTKTLLVDYRFKDYFDEKEFLLNIDLQIISVLPETFEPSQQAASELIVQRLKSIQNTILPPTETVDLYTREEESP